VKKKAIIGAVISLVILVLMLLVIDYGQLWAALKRADYWYLIPFVAVVILSMLLRAWRWRLIVTPLGRISFSRLYASTMIGFMANNILPARLGEAVRAYSLGVRTGISRSALFGTIIVERIYDSFTLLLMLWIVFLFSRAATTTEAAAIKSFGYIFLGINVGLLILLILLQRRTEATLGWLARLTHWLPERIRTPAREIAVKFARGLTLAPSFKTTVGIIVSSLVLWTIMALSNYLIFLAFGYGLDPTNSGHYLPLEASFVVLVVVSLAITLPSTPGYFGVFHAGCILALKAYLDLPPGRFVGEAAAIAIVMHAAQYVPITLLGFYHLKTEHLRFKTEGGRIEVEAENSGDVPGPPAPKPDITH